MRLAELMGTLSLATDLGMGMPFERGLRAASVVVRLAETTASDRDRVDAYYLSFLRYAGCTADSDLAADVMGDEVAVRGELYGVDWGSPPAVLGRLARAVGKGRPPLGAAKRILGTVSKMPRLLATAESHCEVGDRLAQSLGFDERFRAALLQTFERWDGKGWPKRLGRDAIALPMRLCHLADEIEVGHRLGGVDGARALARRRARAAVDPGLVEAFESRAGEVCAPLDAPSPWTEAMAAEPDEPRRLEPDQVDEVLRAIGRFADLKSRHTRTHASGVAELAARAAGRLGLPAEEQRRILRAALVHDVGVVAVSAAVWDKPGALTDAEREAVRMHTYAGERILAKAPSLAPIAEIATLAHERLDGGGYHRKLSAHACPPAARVLAAADVYHAMTEDRAHRAALGPERATAELRELAKTGALCPDAADAVIGAAGMEPSARPSAEPAARLTERELEVLRLVARGLTNKEVATALGISPKTAGHHVEHVFEKLRVTTRAGATITAMQRGLLT